MFPDQAKLAAPEQAQREAGKVWWEAHPSIPILPRRSPVGCGTFLAASTERLFSRPARSLGVSSVDLPLLPLQECDWLRPGRRSWP